MACEKCGKQVEFSNLTPLALEKCPACGDVLFIPMNIGEWWVIQPAAAGGFSSVYLAVSETDCNRKAAAKILRQTKETAGKHADMFIREGEIMEALGTHPNIPKLYEYGFLEDECHAMILLEYVEGVDLDRYVRHIKTKLQPEEALYYALDIADALEHISTMGYIYRDLKPMNVIINKDHVAVLIDFGLCIPLEEAKERAHPVFGSPRLIPPERIMKRGEDIRSDIYALGMTLYFMVMGDWYFTSDSINGVVKSHTMFTRMQTESKMPGMPQPLVKLVDSMIRREPGERPDSYEMLREAVVSLLRDLQLQDAKTDNPVIKVRRKAFTARFGKDSGKAAPAGRE